MRFRIKPRGHKWMHFVLDYIVLLPEFKLRYLKNLVIDYIVLLPEFKLRYLKNLKLFSIRVNELLEPLACKEKATGVCSF